ncbi:hypothetical protein KC19_VG047400 [Ceratodon purpureus]|uniref:Uncharacterized protein n=1 Tax=Ceratodon purpureus TaxID=3225 RepID=A0A8T0HLZ4_CERPU|nr:hypothetical protein KC19_VG047400 [Ceratodon purpureus]
MAFMQKLGASSRLLRSAPSQLTLSRGFAADAHGPAKVPMWNAPTSPSTWKEEHVSSFMAFQF